MGVLFRKLREQMKGIIIIVCIAFAGSLVYFGGSVFQGANNGEPSGPIAQVNGEKISYADFQQQYLSNLQYYQQFSGRLNGAAIETAKFATLQDMVDQALLLQLARREKIQVDKKELDDRIQQIEDQFASRDEYRRQLRENGLTEAKLRERLRDTLLIQNLRKEKSKVAVTDQDLKAAYEEVRASHILIEAKGNEKDPSWQQAKTKADQILAEVRKGADFAQLARKHSADPGSRTRGGDIGFFKRDANLVPEFKEAAFALAVGQVSAPVKTVYGYHLIKVTDRKEAAGDEFEKAKASLKEQVEAEKGQDAFRKWLDAERAKAKIAILDPEMRAIQFVQNGQLPQAVAQYQEAIERDAQNPYLHLMLGQVYEELKDADRALASFQKAVELGENDPELHYRLGRAYQERQMTEKAVASFKKASDLAPMDFTLHQTLHDQFTQMGLAAEAKAEEAKLAEIQRVLIERQKALQEMQQRQGEAPREAEESVQGQEKK